jgi:cell division protein FtsB
MVLGLVLAVGAAGWGGFLYGRSGEGLLHTVSQALKLSAMEKKARRLRERVVELEADNAKLREQVALLERSSKLDRQVSQDVEAHLQTVQAELADLREQLAFYRNVVDPGERKRGLHIQSFTIEPGSRANQFRFNLVAAQVAKNYFDVSGVVDLEIRGSNQAGAETVDWKRLAINGADKPVFSFKYFQSIEGLIQIPDGFKPESVVVQLVPDNKNQRSVRQTIEWPIDAG